MPASNYIPVYEYMSNPFGYLCGTRRRLAQKLAWPTPVEVESANHKRHGGNDDHLHLGISYAAAKEFLFASGWPKDYVRSAEHVQLNGEFVQGNEIGYDLAVFIRNFMYQRGYMNFSVGEVLFAAGHPDIKHAKAFLSHAQAERVDDTLTLLRDAASRAISAKNGRHHPLFVDYFILRQCVPDFELTKIEDAIAKIGLTISGLTVASDGSVGALNRVWCGFEIVCTVSRNAKYMAVMPAGSWTSMPEKQIQRFDLKACQASHPSDKATLMRYFDQLDGGADAASEVVRGVLTQVAKDRWRHNALLQSAYGCFYGFMLALMAFFVLAEHDGWTTSTTVVLVLAVLTGCAWLGLRCGFFAQSRRIQGGRIVSLGQPRQEPAAAPAGGGGGEGGAHAPLLANEV